MLQGTGKVNKPVTHALLALIFQTIVLVPMLLYTNMDLYALCLATVLYSFLMCLMNGYAIRKHLNYRQEMVRTFGLPFFAALWMGGATAGVYYGLAKIMELAGFVSGEMLKNIVCLVPSLIVAGIVYFALVIKTGAIRKNELKSMPKGHLLLKIAQKLHLIH